MPPFECKPHETFPCSNPQGCGGPFCKIVKERERNEAQPMFGYPVADWHRVFAWWPTDTYDQGWKWLCVIERRRIHKHAHLDGGAGRWWQHRAKQKVA